MENLEKAIEIIGNRRTDQGLLRKVADIIGDDVPSLFQSSDVMVGLAPHVAGGTVAEQEFVEEVMAAGGRPVITSYNEDRFTAANTAKVNHWRPKIACPKGQITRQWIVASEWRQVSGATVGNTPTIYSAENGPLTVAEYQRNVGAIAFALRGGEVSPPCVVDYSAWYERQSVRRSLPRAARGYYPAVMAVYSVFGVMFRYDNQPGEKAIMSFRREVAEPAATAVSSVLGVQPVIVARQYPDRGMITDLQGLTAAAAKNIQKYGRMEAV